MKKFFGVLFGFTLLAGLVPARAADMHKMDDRLNNAADVLQEVMHTPDRGIPQSILAGASCVLVVPHYKKGAFIIGADYGQGVATCRTGHGWSAPVFIKLTGGSFGWQIGGQSTDLVLVAMNRHGMQDLIRDNFKLGGDAAASAGPVGRNAQAGTDWKLGAEFLTYSRSRGLFAGLDLTGTAVSQNHDDMRAEYNADIPFERVLRGDVPVPPNAQRFVRTVARYFVVSRDNQ